MTDSWTCPDKLSDLKLLEKILNGFPYRGFLEPRFERTEPTRFSNSRYATSKSPRLYSRQGIREWPLHEGVQNLGHLLRKEILHAAIFSQQAKGSGELDRDFLTFEKIAVKRFHFPIPLRRLSDIYDPPRTSINPQPNALDLYITPLPCHERYEPSLVRITFAQMQMIQAYH